MDLYIEKDSDLMRSTFVAVGIASLFHALGRNQQAIRIGDLGSAYRIAVPYDAVRAHEYLRGRADDRLPALIPAIRKPFSPGEKKELDSDPNSLLHFKYVPNGFNGTVVEYERERAIVKAAIEARKSAKEGREEGDAAVPDRDYPLWAHLCSYFGKGSAMKVGYPTVLHTWFAHRGEQAHHLLDLIIETFCEPYADIDAMHQRWRAGLFRSLDYTDYKLDVEISALAIVSPTTSKGGASATGAALLNEDTPKTFWLLMYLAFAGYMVIAMPYNRGDDVLLYYPLPRDIAFSRLRLEMDTFRMSDDARRLYNFSNRTERAKLDILAALTFYRQIVEHFAMQQPDDVFGSPIDAYSGLMGYYYKDIGSAQIPFDEVSFALPRWLPNDPTPDALEEARDLMKRHFGMIEAVRGKSPKYELKADELVVLNSYRTFMTQGAPDLWIDFAIAYNLYRFRNMPDIYLPDLHLTTFERTLMNMQSKIDYRPILENPGFQNIAAAIRSATVSNRYLEDVKRIETGFRTRHGLGDDLMRDAADPELFMMALSGFIHDYTRETSNVQAKDATRRRPFITSDDLHALAGLIADYGSRIVAHLLVATGYASDYKAPSE